MPSAAWPTRGLHPLAHLGRALFVKVIARICDGQASRFASRRAMRRVRTLVLPDPAPATMSSDSPRYSTASFCWGLRPAVKGSSYPPARVARARLGGLVEGVEHDRHDRASLGATPARHLDRQSARPPTTAARARSARSGWSANTPSTPVRTTEVNHRSQSPYAATSPPAPQRPGQEPVSRPQRPGVDREPGRVRPLDDRAPHRLRVVDGAGVRPRHQGPQVDADPVELAAAAASAASVRSSAQVGAADPWAATSSAALPRASWR